MTAILNATLGAGLVVVLQAAGLFPIPVAIKVYEGTIEYPLDSNGAILLVVAVLAGLLLFNIYVREKKEGCE